MEKIYYVYILTNTRNTIFYVGLTNDLDRRMLEHKNGLFRGFTYKYNVSKLVYFEEHSSICKAIKRENSIKRWKRQWKIDLITKDNPDFLDLS